MHDLPKHKESVILIKLNFKGYLKETALIPKEPYDDLTNETSYPEIYRIDILKMHKSGKSFLR